MTSSLDTPAKRLRWARERHGQYKTGTAAARAFGWVVSTYLGNENGDRVPSIGMAKRYGRAYRVRWEWVLTGEGEPLGRVTEAPIDGQVVGNSQIEFYPPEKTRHTTALPPGGSIRTVAVEVAGGSMRGIADDQWLVFFDDSRADGRLPSSEDLIGRLCVVELDSGDILIRKLQRGRRKGRFDLEFPLQETIRDAKVVWAARVTWIKPR